MKSINHKINLKIDRAIINILGEICWGFHIDNFEKKIGEKKDVVKTLLERLLKEEKEGVLETNLNDKELEIIRKALNEVENEIEEWEFQTRIGFPLEKVKKILIFK
jgi:uncharacterized membrane protein